MRHSDRLDLPLGQTHPCEQILAEGYGDKHHDRQREDHPESSCQRTPCTTQIVAAICCIEIPQRKWEGIAEKITSNMNNENLVVKEVSILTIGFIC